MITGRWILVYVLLCTCAHSAPAQVLRPGAVQLFCHRTDNRDVPENTLESLTLAARIGCNAIEVDVRRTLDGILVLNHDGYLDRFTNTTGDIETASITELDRMDFGAWRSARFRGIHLAHFDAALRLARQLNVTLHLDIKTEGLATQILAEVAREGMTDRVVFAGDWNDVRALPLKKNYQPTTYLQPGMTAAQVDTLHRQGHIVVGNFLLNRYEMDLPAMRSAVAAGVDALWVEYPRLGADAIGRPVEATLATLCRRAETGASADRVAAIRELADFIGFPTQACFVHLLLDADEAVSHAAAVALVDSRPNASVSTFISALTARTSAARRNAAWAIGTLSAAGEPGPCISPLLPLLSDSSPAVAQQTLLSLTWCKDSTPVPVDRLLPFLSSPVPVMRGLAAIALAKYQPNIASRVVPLQLAKEEHEAALYQAELKKRGNPKLMQPEIDIVIELYRAQMKFIQALAMLPAPAALRELTQQSFRSATDYSSVTGLAAGYKLWDLLGDDPQPAIDALSSTDATIADRALWALVYADPRVLPTLHKALLSSTGDARRRLICIAAWRADPSSSPTLHQLEASDPEDAELLHWALNKIAIMEPRRCLPP